MNKSKKLLNNSNPELEKNLALSIDKIKELAQIGRFDESEEMCRKLVLFDPSSVEAAFYMGVILESKEKIDEAEKYYLTALKLNPLHYETLVHLRFVYEYLGKSKKAEKLMKHLAKVIS